MEPCFLYLSLAHVRHLQIDRPSLVINPNASLTLCSSWVNTSDAQPQPAHNGYMYVHTFLEMIL